MKKIAIVTTHPIQYNAPFFRQLAVEKKVILKVFYTWGQKGAGKRFDPGFEQLLEWDIPLLEGYEFEFLVNNAKNPGSHHFWGINCPELYSRVKDFMPDAVLIYGWNFYSHLRLMIQLKGKIPVWFRGDSTLLDEPGQTFFKVKLRRVFLRWLYRFVDLVFYAGKANKAYFEAHGLKPEQLVFMPHAVDNDRFSHHTPELEEQIQLLINKLDLYPQHKVLLFVGKFEKKKNPGLLLCLMERMSDANIRLLFVGDGPLRSLIENAAKKDHRILLLPFQNQSLMPAIYRLGHLLILPSTGPGETWGLVINESLASGTPVMASKLCGGAYDLLLDDHRFDPYNLEEFRMKIEVILKSGYPIINRKIDTYSIDSQINSVLSAISYKQLSILNRS